MRRAMSTQGILLAKLLLALAISVPLLAAVRAPATAADMASPPPAAAAEDPVAALEDYLRREAVLLLLRARFDVIATDQVPDVLAAEARRMGAAGPTAADLEQLDRDLLAEGSYYIVSLRYLAQLGGALWPDDRPERYYVDDALILLDALQVRLLQAVESREDPLPVFLRLQEIDARTEGYAELPPERDWFSGRDELVTNVMAAAGPRART